MLIVHNRQSPTEANPPPTKLPQGDRQSSSSSTIHVFSNRRPNLDETLSQTLVLEDGPLHRESRRSMRITNHAIFIIYQVKLTQAKSFQERQSNFLTKEPYAVRAAIANPSNASKVSSCAVLIHAQKKRPVIGRVLWLATDPDPDRRFDVDGVLLFFYKRFFL